MTVWTFKSKLLLAIQCFERTKVDIHTFLGFKKKKKWILKDIQPIPEALCLLLSIFIFIRWKVQEGQVKEGTDRQSVLDSFKKDQQYL